MRRFAALSPLAMVKCYIFGFNFAAVDSYSNAIQYVIAVCLHNDLYS